ncbi:MBL fold metallo-hydrolase [candidate division KSB1 bacterium]
MKIKTTFNSLVFLLCISIFQGCSVAPDNDRISVHYLGHSSFIINFGGRFSVLTDPGKSNSYGLDSPIYDVGDFTPDIVTISHTGHSDHYTGDIPENVKFVLTDIASLDFDGLEIQPVRTSESSLEERSNTSYVFRYNGLTIIHIGDAQANIMNIEDEENRKLLKEGLPDDIDLLLMTIQGVSEFIEEAESFIDFLSPKIVIPMHYWSEEYKSTFLDYLKNLNNSGKNYVIEEINSPEYIVSNGNIDHNKIRIISLEPGPFTGKIR